MCAGSGKGVVLNLGAGLWNLRSGDEIEAEM